MQNNILFIDTEKNKRDRDELFKSLTQRMTLNRTLYDTVFTDQGDEALKILKEKDISVIVSDIQMLQKDELKLLKSIKTSPKSMNIPIIVSGHIADFGARASWFEFNRMDYIRQPYDIDDLCSRIEVQLKSKRMYDELKFKNKILAHREVRLMGLAEAGSNEVENVNMAMVQALENACYFNDEDTGHHLKRVSKYSVVIAGGLGCKTEFVKRIRLYAPLHDVGKVGIPDDILKKKGRFTEEEAAIMREHVVIGARFLDITRLGSMAKNIALYHHEKWDGSGYPRGLEGEEIPLEARILSVADVYDALSFDRVYRKALPEEQIDDIFRNRGGTFFDPRIIQVYFKVKKQLIEIKAGVPPDGCLRRLSEGQGARHAGGVKAPPGPPI